jgi:adenosylmethionine-8-amino-7-oxononanoate aminotransferase
MPFTTRCLDVMPETMTTAKGLTNGSVPMGVFVREHIHQAS